MKALIRYFKSLRFLIFILLLIFGIIPGLFLRVGILNVYQNHIAQNYMSDLSNQVTILSNQILSEDYLNDTSAAELDAQMEQLGAIYDGRVLLIDDSFHIVKDTYHTQEGKTILSDAVTKAYQGTESKEIDLSSKFMQLTAPVYAADSNQIYAIIQVSSSTEFLKSSMVSVRVWAGVLQLILIFIVLMVGFFLSSRMVRPFRKLATSIHEVKDGYSSDFEFVDSYAETEKISDSCSDMLARLQLLDESRQEFVSNVSHELKTPLTSMKVLADSLTGVEDVPVELYQEFMSDIDAEIERENKIINDLLSLVKMDKSSTTINIENVNINALLELIMKRLKPIAEQSGVDLVLETFRPVTADIDEVKLSLAFTNLIENAIKYNKEGGYVHVSLNADHQNFFFKVEDNGIGIPQEDQAHIYERFYRVDKSHSRQIGGTGLGLAITRNAIIMHKGEIELHSVEGEGTTFAVRIPLKYTK